MPEGEEVCPGARGTTVLGAATWRIAPSLLVAALLLAAMPHVLAYDFGLRATIEGPEEGTPGEELAFDASASEGSIVEYSWDFHDGARAKGARVNHSFASEGRYTVALSVTGRSGHQALATFAVEVRNRAPLAHFTGPMTARQDEVVVFDGSDSLDPDGGGAQALSFRWDLGDGSSAEGPLATHAFAVPGEYLVRLTVADAAGALGFQVRPMTIVGSPPVARLRGPANLWEGEEGLFDASESTDSPSDARELRYSWDFGDGSRASGARVHHAYRLAGVYEVAVAVVDAGGLSGGANLTVTVKNRPPELRLSVPEGVEEGTPFVARAVISESPNDVPILSYTWSNGARGSRTVVTPWDEGDLPLALEVRDDDGAGSTAGATVRVANAPPRAAITNVYATATFTLAIASREGTPATFQLLRSSTVVAEASLVRLKGPPFDQAARVGPLDLRLDENWTALVLFGTEAIPPPNASAALFLDIDFDDGTRESLHHTVVRGKPATWIWIVNVNALFLGHRLHTLGEALDRGADDLTLTWALPDGTTASLLAPAAPGRPNYAVDGRSFTLDAKLRGGDRRFEIVLRAADADGGVGSTSVGLSLKDGVLRAENLAPSARLLPALLEVEEDQAVTLVGTATDGLTDQAALRFSWAFGDGGGAAGPIVSHGFRDAGIYPVLLRAEDPAGAASLQVVVLAVRNRGPAVVAMDPVKALEDEPLLFLPRLDDSPGDIEGMAALWDFGDGGWAVGTRAGHSYARAGSHRGMFWATDDDGARVAVPFLANIANIPPEPLPLLRSEAVAGEVLLLEAEAGDGPSDLPLIRYLWETGDRTLVGRRAAWRPPVGIFTVTLTVVDDDEASTANFTVEVAPPVPPLHIANLRLLGDGLLTDPGLSFGAPLLGSGLATWSFGDGAFDVQPQHRFTRDGTYDLTLELALSPRITVRAVAMVEVQLDNDGDGIGDALEAGIGGNPWSADSDADGQLDSTELLRSPATLLNAADSDGDGLWDGFNISAAGVIGELGLGTDPLNPDTDGDGAGDGTEVRGWEVRVLREGQEVAYRTTSDPFQPDTDLDGLGDVEEFRLRSDPRDADTDRDGLDDLEEVSRGEDGATTSPLTPDTDADGVWDYFDRDPGGVSAVQWRDRYPPGLIQFEQEYHVYSVHAVSAYVYRYSLLGGCAFEADRTADSTKGSVLSEAAVRDQVFADLIRAGQSNYSSYRAVQLPGLTSSYYLYSVGQCDLFHPNRYDITYEVRATPWAVRFLNWKDVGVFDEEGKPQLYALADVGVELGADQSVIVQFSLAPNGDRTTSPGDPTFTIPALAYSLFRSRAFGDGPVYSNVAVAAPLADHAYEAEIQLPADVLRPDTTSETEDGRMVTLLILPVWVSSSGGHLSRRALDPGIMSVASITRQTSVNAVEIIARLESNLTDLRSRLPGDLSAYSTGYYEFGPYRVYVFNSPQESFDEASLESVDAVVLVEISQARLVRLREGIPWEHHKGWVENYNDAFNTSTRLFNFALRLLNTVVKIADMRELAAYRKLNIGQIRITNHGQHTIVVGKVLVGDKVLYLVSRVEKGYTDELEIPTSSGTMRARVFEWGYRSEEITADIEHSSLLPDRYRPFRSGIRTGQVGLIAVTQGRQAAIAYLAGDTVKASLFTASSAASVVSLYTSDVLLEDLNVRGRLSHVKVGTVAAVAAGCILVSYDLHEGITSSDPIARRSHFESAAAMGVDYTVGSVPTFGYAVQFGWLGGNLLMSYILPNSLVSKITSSPGSTITFLFEYEFTSEIPSIIATDALDNAIGLAVELARLENQIGASVAVIPPQ